MTRWLQRCGQSISRTNYNMLDYFALLRLMVLELGSLVHWVFMKINGSFSCWFTSEQHTGLRFASGIWQFCFLLAGTPWGDCQTLTAFPRDWRETASPWALDVIRVNEIFQDITYFKGWVPRKAEVEVPMQTLFVLCVICWFSKEHQIHVSLLTMEQKWTQNETQHRSLESRLENLEGQLRVQSVASKSTPGSPESIAMAFLKEAEKNWAEFLVFLTFLFPVLAHLFHGFKLFFMGLGPVVPNYIYIIHADKKEFHAEFINSLVYQVTYPTKIVSFWKAFFVQRCPFWRPKTCQSSLG